jgi:hypothetical protein
MTQNDLELSRMTDSDQNWPECPSTVLKLFCDAGAKQTVSGRSRDLRVTHQLISKSRQFNFKRLRCARVTSRRMKQARDDPLAKLANTA